MRLWRANDCPYREKCAMPSDKMITHRGPLDAEVVVIGQSPGEEEYKQGKPFVGPAGRELCKTLRDVGWDEKELLFTNAVMCMPPRNATPQTTQIRLCRPHLMELLKLHPRKLLICVGNEAWASIHEVKSGGVLKGAGTVRHCDELNCETIWTLHPSFVLREPSQAAQLAHDLTRAQEVYAGKEIGLPEIDYYICHPKYQGAPRMRWVREIQESPYLVVDIESTGLSWQTDGLLGVGLGWEGSNLSTDELEERYAYISIEHGDPPRLVWGSDMWGDVIYPFLVDTLSGRPGRKLIAQNAKFDVKFLRHALNIDIAPLSVDTLVLSAHVDENRPHGLKESASFYLDAPMWDEIWKDEEGNTLSSYVDAKSKHLGMTPVSECGKYCCYDCYYTKTLATLYWERMTEGQRELYTHVQIPQANMLLEMELRGMGVDRKSLADTGKKLKQRIKEIEEQVNKVTGLGETVLPSRSDEKTGVNLRSHPDVRYVTFAHYGLADLVSDENRWRTDKGELSTNEETLEFLLTTPFLADEPKRFLELVLLHRGLATTFGTFVNGLLERSAYDGRAHSTYTQHVAESGRLSSRNPNLQNIPKSMRPFFVPVQGNVFVDADYDTLEVTVWAHYSQDPKLIDALTYNPDRSEAENDFHRVSAGIFFDKDVNAVTDDERTKAKTLVFGGGMYGGGAGVISRQMHITLKEAQSKLDGYIQSFALGYEWLQGQVEFAREHLYVASDLGRIRRIPAIVSTDKKIRGHAERQAMNSVIQGTASDICGIGMLRAYKALKEEGLGHFVNTVHDQALRECKREDAEQVVAIMEAEMTRCPYNGFSMPLSVTIEVVDRWGGEIDMDKILERENV